MMKWMVKQVNQKNKGFTLIEMVVVLAIIAVLIAIAVPQVMRQINKAKINADIANAKAIATAIQQYVADGNTLENSSYQPVSNLSWISNYITGGVPKVKYNNNWGFAYLCNSNSVNIAVYTNDTPTLYYRIYPDISDKDVGQNNSTTGSNTNPYK